MSAITWPDKRTEKLPPKRQIMGAFLLTFSYFSIYTLTESFKTTGGCMAENITDSGLTEYSKEINIRNPLSFIKRDFSKYPVLDREQEEVITRNIHRLKTQILVKLCQTEEFQAYLASVKAHLVECIKEKNDTWVVRVYLNKVNKEVSLLQIINNIREILRLAKRPVKTIKARQLKDEKLFSSLETLNLSWTQLKLDGVFETTFISKELDVLQEQLDLLVLSNMRLVVSVAAGRGSKFQLEDRVQEGMMGLMKAAERFDPRLGNRFVTYAVPWIQSFADRAQLDLIRAPEHVKTSFFSLRKVASERNLSLEDAAVEIGMNKDKAKLVVDLQQTMRPVSLDAQVGSDEQDTNLYQLIASEEGEDVFETIDRKRLQDFFQNRLSELLSPRELEIVSLLFGINGNSEHTLQEVADNSGVSRQAIQQIYDRTIKKLRHHPDFKELHQYLL
jgi:RNA polymerase primary sigma factor